MHQKARRLERQGLYDPYFEHDACGVGFVANIDGVKSHAIVQKGLTVLENLTHRGACGCDPLTGDGAGLIIQVPDAFLRKVCGASDVDLPPAGEYGVGLVFLPRDVRERNFCESEFEKIVREEGQRPLGWRSVPIDERQCGPLAHSSSRPSPSSWAVPAGSTSATTAPARSGAVPARAWDDSARTGSDGGPASTRGS